MLPAICEGWDDFLSFYLQIWNMASAQFKSFEAQLRG